MAETAEELKTRMAELHRAAQATPPATKLQPIKGKAAYILDTLHPEEPIFVLRAKDLLSPLALLAYRDLIDQYNPGGDIARDINAAISAFRLWQTGNPDRVKFPD